MREAATICPRPLQVDLLTLKAVSESRVTWATSVSNLVFLGLSVLDLGRDRQTSDAHRLMPLALGGGGITNVQPVAFISTYTHDRIISNGQRFLFLVSVFASCLFFLYRR